MLTKFKSELSESVQSENYKILLEHIFKSDEMLLIRRLQEESENTGKSISTIVLGYKEVFEEQRRHEQKRPKFQPYVFAIGGGGGFNKVTLKALRMLNFKLAAGMTSTDDGGNTGKLKENLEKYFSYIFGMGDCAAALEELIPEVRRSLYSYRVSKNDRRSFVDIVTQQVLKLKELDKYLDPKQDLAPSDNLLSFICYQFYFALIIDNFFVNGEHIKDFPLAASSVRNLIILAAFYKLNAYNKIGTELKNDVLEYRTERAWQLIEDSLGISSDDDNYTRIIPVSYDKARLRAQYNKPIPQTEIHRLEIKPEDLENRRTILGQKYLDKLVFNGKIVNFGLVPFQNFPGKEKPQTNLQYLELLASTKKMIVVGAGSLYGSQLAQLAFPKVLDTIIMKKNIRKVLVINHVCMDETANYSLTDHIQAIEKLANVIVSVKIKKRLKRVRIGDIFTDIIVPRTVAREIEKNIKSERKKWKPNAKLTYVDAKGRRSNPAKGIPRNEYVDFVLSHKRFLQQHQITEWELRVLGSMKFDPRYTAQSDQEMRMERGRYRGAVYATEKDIKYLIEKGGIPRRNIFEVESVAMARKRLKKEGKEKFEYFPGLLPESLVGIFKILLAKGAYK